MTDSLMGATHKIQTIRKKKTFYGKMQDKQYKKRGKGNFMLHLIPFSQFFSLDFSVCEQS